MKSLNYLGNFVLILCVILLASNALIISTKKHYFTAIEPATFFAACVGMLFLLCFFNIKSQNSKSNTIFSYFKFIFPLFSIGCLYVLLYSVGFGNQKSDATTQYVYIILFNIICSVIIYSYLNYYSVTKEVLNFIFEITLLVIIISVFIDVLHPGTFSPTETRAAGLPENPNSTSFRVASILAVLLFSEISIKKKYFYLVFASLATFATFSRSGILLLLIVIAFFIVKNLQHLRKINWFKVIGLSIFLLISYEIATASINLPSLLELFDKQLNSERFNMVTSSESFTNMEDPRVTLARMYFHKALDQPLVGYGPLSSTVYSQGPHNMFLLLWFETGLLGLILYLLFFLNLYRYAKLSKAIPVIIWGICVLTNSFFSHNLLSEYFFVFVTPLIYYYTQQSETV
ncbi:O-antigen ligase family protein [Rubrolithibacter danxiaensis]|uniref:O-antigen ligase family protein n=1 Tax=Rubrolithibacter danxiaensis TaxID=3390805 RepID=UPI003BF779A4